MELVVFALQVGNICIEAAIVGSISKKVLIKLYINIWLILVAEGTEFKIPVFKLKKKDEDKFLTADAVDSSLDILSDSNDAKQKWYVLIKKWTLRCFRKNILFIAY